MCVRTRGMCVFSTLGRVRKVKFYFLFSIIHFPYNFHLYTYLSFLRLKLIKLIKYVFISFSMQHMLIIAINNHDTLTWMELRPRIYPRVRKSRDRVPPCNFIRLLGATRCLVSSRPAFS